VTDFLLELGVEELPPFEIYDIAHQMEMIFKEFLEENRIPFERINIYFTPRRIAVLITNLADTQETWESEIVGPPAKIAFDADGNPTKALSGFLESRGLKLEDVFIEENRKGAYVKARMKGGGKSSIELLNAFLPGLLLKLKLTKSMRWNNSGARFLRPIRWVLCLLGKEVLPVDIGGLKAGNTTYGHRLKGNEKICVPEPRLYLKLLEERYVVADPVLRRETIRNKLHGICEERQLVWEEDDELLSEVVNLVEYPGVIAGSFPDKYLELPDAVTITAMKQHQRYFALRRLNGELSHYFITAIDNTEDLEREIGPNHEKVLRARLEDAEFYMHEDLKVPLESRVEELKKVVFREGIGSMFDKIERMKLLCEELRATNCNIRADLLYKALYLCKVDLTTLMIKDGKEFTKLEGIIGMEYALRQGKDEELARIIYDHVLPRFPGDELPLTQEGALISISDKIDNLFAFLKSGAQLSTSSDPFGLRRTLYAIFEIVKVKKIRFDFVKLAKKAAELLEVEIEDFNEFMEWAWKRLENYLEEKEGIRYDIVDSVIGARTNDLWEIIERARVLHQFYIENQKEFEEVVVGQKRAHNILQGVEPQAVSEELFEKDEERELHRVLNITEPMVREALEREEYQKALKYLRSLKPYIDRFFDMVFVMVDDLKLRANRLALLYEVRECFRLYCDFSKIVV